jgi:hypothetical protein
MADPVSMVGLVIAIPSIVQALMAYCSDAKSATEEISTYIADLFSLQGILQYIQTARTPSSQQADASKYNSAEIDQLLEMTKKEIRGLQTALEPGFGVS